MNIALYRPPFPPEGDRVVAIELVRDVIEYPGWTNSDVRVRRSVAVGDLIETVGERERRERFRSSRVGHLREFTYKGQVLRAVTLVSV